MGVERHVRSAPYRSANRRVVGACLSVLWVLWTGLFFPPPGYGAAPRIIEDVRFHSAAAATRVVIEVDGTVQHAVGRLQQPDRLYIDLPRTRLAPDWARKHVKVGDTRVHAIRIAQHRIGVVRVVLDLQKLPRYRVFTLAQPYRIVIDLEDDRKVLSPNAPPQSLPPSAFKSLPPSPTTPPTIVIDPGHGGKDPGAIGPRGLQEKTVVLQVANELRQVIRKELPHYRVILTRDRDVYISLSERANMANKHQAEVFISIHANASPKRHARGIETWYLSFAANERAQQTAARENNMTTSQLSELERILLDLQETDRINQSAVLAGLTQAALVDRMSAYDHAIPNRGVEGAPFVVLLHTSMPSILVEIAFVSNPLEEKRLRGRKYQQALAQGIFGGVRQFLQDAMVKAQ